MIDEILKKAACRDAQINGEDEYVKTAVMAILLDDPDEPKLLFEKRAAFVKQPGEISLPGGLFDPSKDSSTLDTAYRETEEEVGLSREILGPAVRLSTVIAPMGVVVHPYLCVVKGVDVKDLVIDSLEVETVFALPLSTFLSAEPEQYSVKLIVDPFTHDDDGRKVELFPAARLGLPEKYHKPWGYMSHKIYLYKTYYGAIWGITGRIVREITCLMKDSPEARRSR